MTPSTTVHGDASLTWAELHRRPGFWADFSPELALALMLGDRKRAQ